MTAAPPCRACTTLCDAAQSRDAPLDADPRRFRQVALMMMSATAALLALTLHATPTETVHAEVPIDPWKTSSLLVAGVGAASGITSGIGGIVLAGRSNGLKSAIAKFASPTPDEAALIALKKRQVAGTQVFVASFGAVSAAAFIVAGGLFATSVAVE